MERGLPSRCIVALVLGWTVFASGPAGDPSGLAEPVLSFTSGDGLEWEPALFQRLWNVYRGDFQVLQATGEYTQVPGSNATALEVCSRNATWYEDQPALAPGTAAFYLVTAVALTVDWAATARATPEPGPAVARRAISAERGQPNYLAKTLELVVGNMLGCIMPRALRIEYEGANFHVMCRGNRNRGTPDLFGPGGHRSMAEDTRGVL